MLDDLIIKLQAIQKQLGNVVVPDWDGYEVNPSIGVIDDKQSEEFDMNEGETYVFLKRNC